MNNVTEQELVHDDSCELAAEVQTCHCAERENARRVREWRTKAALRDAPDVALHVRSLALRGKTERGETLPEWTAPMQITATDDVDGMYAQLVNWTAYWAEVLEVDPPSVTIVAWSNLREVQGFRAGTTPEGAQALVRLHTMWLQLKTEQIREHAAADAILAYQENILEIMAELRGRYPRAPRPERKVSPRQCPACGAEAVHAEWLTPDDGRDVDLRCENCGQDIVEHLGRQRQLGRILDWLVPGEGPRVWAAGDPCEACGSRNTGVDLVIGGFCRACGRSDADQ